MEFAIMFVQYSSIIVLSNYDLFLNDLYFTYKIHMRQKKRAFKQFLSGFEF